MASVAQSVIAADCGGAGFGYGTKFFAGG